MGTVSVIDIQLQIECTSSRTKNKVKIVMWSLALGILLKYELFNISMIILQVYIENLIASSVWFIQCT